MPADALGYMEAMLPTPSLITDLLDLRAASTVTRHQVITTGERL
jgi:hypothetical protein